MTKLRASDGNVPIIVATALGDVEQTDVTSDETRETQTPTKPI